MSTNQVGLNLVMNNNLAQNTTQRQTNNVVTGKKINNTIDNPLYNFVELYSNTHANSRSLLRSTDTVNISPEAIQAYKTDAKLQVDDTTEISNKTRLYLPTTETLTVKSPSFNIPSTQSMLRGLY